MKKLLHKDSIALGIVATLLSEVLCALLVLVVILLTHTPMLESARWFAIAFVPPLLLLRHYAKIQDYPTTLKTVITTFFIPFEMFMWFMMKYKYISF